MSFRFLLLFILAPGVLSFADGELLHYTCPTRVGDPHPDYEAGVFYLNYVYKTKDGWPVGHIRSSDLLHWEEQQLSHDPAPAEDDMVPDYFALDVLRDPVNQCYRTYYGYKQISTSVSFDRLHWKKGSPHAVLTGLKDRYAVARDPGVFWNETEKKWWMLLTMRRKDSPKGSGGLVGFATSEDLVNFTFEGELYTPEDISEPEVPTMFKIGDQWVLMFSMNKDRCTHYRVSDNPRGPWRTPVPAVVDGPDFYAGITCAVNQRRLLFGWIRNAPLGFGGHLSLPREVYAHRDGTLGFRLEESVSRKIRGDMIKAPLKIDNPRWRVIWGVVISKAMDGIVDSYAMLEGMHDRFDLQLDIWLFPSSGRVGIVIGKNPKNSGARVVIDADQGQLLVETASGTILAALDIVVPRDKWMTLRVVAEGRILEIFFDDRYCLTAVLSEELQKTQFGLYSSSEGMFRNINLYQLRSLQEIPQP